MRFVVFECRKCGHTIYAECTEDLFRDVGRISCLECPTCGEDPEGNWVLVGLRNGLPKNGDAEL